MHHEQFNRDWTKRVYTSIKTELRFTVASPRKWSLCLFLFCVLSFDMCSTIYRSRIIRTYRIHIRVLYFQTFHGFIPYWHWLWHFGDIHTYVRNNVRKHSSLRNVFLNLSQGNPLIWTQSKWKAKTKSKSNVTTTTAAVQWLKRFISYILFELYIVDIYHVFAFWFSVGSLFCVSSLLALKSLSLKFYDIFFSLLLTSCLRIKHTKNTQRSHIYNSIRTRPNKRIFFSFFICLYVYYKQHCVHWANHLSRISHTHTYSLNPEENSLIPYERMCNVCFSISQT